MKADIDLSQPRIISRLTYVLYVERKLLRSCSGLCEIELTIDSVLKQTILVSDLLVITHYDEVVYLTSFIDTLIAARQTDRVGQIVGESRHWHQITGDQFETSTTSPRIYLFQSPNKNISGAIETVLSAIKTDWVSILEPGMRISPNANFDLMRTIHENSNAAILYADHDLVDLHGFRKLPSFKPIFSLDLLYSRNYIGKFIAIKTNYLFKYTISGATSDNLNLYVYGLILYVIESLIGIFQVNSKLINLSKKIIHIPSILHSESTVGKSAEVNDLQQSKAQMSLLSCHVSRLYVDTICHHIRPFLFRVKWPLPEKAPLVSLVIPTKNSFQILRACISSIINRTTYKNYEILIVDNQTTDKKTLRYISDISNKYDFIQVIHYDHKFNYSDMNNLAVKQARGELLGFVNNDIEVLNGDWLSEMVSHAIRPDVGCVGAMHFYPDKLIQHAGVVLGMHGVADHAFKGSKKQPIDLNVQDDLACIRNPDAVTAATLVLRKELFEAVDGFDSQHLKIAFNDVDLCLKITKLGYRCVWTPYAELIHHESKTRKIDQSAEMREIEAYEHQVMKSRWKTDQVVPRDILKSIFFNIL